MKKQQSYTQENTENNYFEISHNYIFTFLTMINKGKTDGNLCRMGNAKNTPFCILVKDFLGCAEQN